MPQVVRELDDAGVHVQHLELNEPSLDDVFAEATGYRLEGSGDHAMPSAGDADPEPSGNRVGVAAALVVLVALVVGGIAAGIGLGRAVKAERAARREAESAKQVAEFLVGLFHASSPGEAGDTLTARGLLDRGLERIESEPPADPLVRARVIGAISDSYMNLDEFESGLRAARAALAAAQSARPRDDVEVALVDRAIALLSPRPEADPALLASCWYRKARLRMHASAIDEADSLIAKAIAVANTAPKPDAALLVRIHSTRASLASWRTHYDVALAEQRRALAYAIEASEPMSAAGLHSGLASSFLMLGQRDSALVHAQIGVDMARTLYAPDHRSLAVALGRLAETRVDLRQFPEAIAAEEEAVRIMRKPGAPREQLAFELAVLGDVYRSAGKLEAGLRVTREALDLNRAVYGVRHYRVAETMGNLASYEMEAGHLAAADTLFRGCIALLEANQEKSFVLPVFRMYRGNLLLDLDRLVEADTLSSTVAPASVTSSVTFSDTPLKNAIVSWKPTRCSRARGPDSTRRTRRRAATPAKRCSRAHAWACGRAVSRRPKRSRRRGCG